MGKIIASMVKINPMFAFLFVIQTFISIYMSTVLIAIVLGFFGTFLWNAEGKGVMEQWTIVKPIAGGYNLGIHFGQLSYDVDHLHDQIDCDCTEPLE